MTDDALSPAAELRAEVAAQVRRLDYAVLQLTREAKFQRRNAPEGRRFFRAHDVVIEVRQSLQDLSRSTLNGVEVSGATTRHPHRIDVGISENFLRFGSDITFKGICDAGEGATCRMWCNAPECREEASEDHEHHVLVDQGMCGVIGTLNADPSMIQELYTGPSTSLRSDFIELEQDSDGVTWRYYGDESPTHDYVDCAPTCRHECPECRLGLGSHLQCDPRCLHHIAVASR